MRGFFPAKKFGGPAVSIYNLCKLLKGKYDFYIITANHDLDSKEPLVDETKKKFENCKVYYLNESQINYYSLSKIVSEVQPNIIYVNSLFSAKYFIPFLFYSVIHKIPLVYSSKG
jgi:hypothetical protein